MEVQKRRPKEAFLCCLQRWPGKDRTGGQDIAYIVITPFTFKMDTHFAVAVQVWISTTVAECIKSPNQECMVVSPGIFTQAFCIYNYLMQGSSDALDCQS